MSRVIKVFKTIRNNWKKSVFFSGVAIFGAYYGRNKYLEFNLMKAYCEEAMKYGVQKISPVLQPRHVTVILNPVSNKKKGKADYEKYCEPLLHLAGLKVSVVITEAEGQAKDLMEIMDNTDCVLVAGGDGTVHEVVTGLLRRNDAHIAANRFPIGIVPVGRQNLIAYKLNSNVYDPTKDMKAKVLAESTMAVIREVLNDVDVIKVEGEQGRPVYSLNQINIGQIRNTITKVDQYWYLGQKMKPYLTFFFQSFKDLSKGWDEGQPIEVSYTKPCSGCSKCYSRFEIFPAEPETNISTPKSSSRWWYMFLPRNNSKTEPKTIDPKAQELALIKSTINDDCDQLHSLSIKSKNILIRNTGTADPNLELIIHPSDLERFKFISEGVRIYRNQEYVGDEESVPYQIIPAKEYQINLPVKNLDTPVELEKLLDFEGAEITKAFISKIDRKINIEPSAIGFDLLNEIEARSTSIRELDDMSDPIVDADPTANKEVAKKKEQSEFETEDSGQWFSIDNENYEFQSTLKVSLLPRRVQIYHSRSESNL